MVEMLTVCARSPPVPTTSTAAARTSSVSGTSVALASIVLTRPASSPAVSPLARSAMANAATCAGVADPDMISAIAHAVSSVDSSVPRNSVLISCGQVRSPTAASRSGRRI
jgi:hypothetical protein